MGFDGIVDFIVNRKAVQPQDKGFADINEFVKTRQASEPTEQLGLVEEVSRFLENYKDDDRAPGFHVSEVAYKFCPVKYIIGKVLEQKRQIPYHLRFRFDVGSALHEMVQEYFAKMQILKGFWKCPNGHITTEISLKPEKCPTCGAKNLHYEEIFLSHDLKNGHAIVGSTDGVLCWRGETLGLEMKTLEPHVLSMMSKPYPYPIIQLNIYMHLLRMKLFPEMKRGIVLLVAPMDKDAILLPMKSFFIDYTDSYWKDGIEKVTRAIELEEAYRAEKLTAQTLIANRICPTRSHGVKTHCDYLSQCFDAASLVTLLKGKPDGSGQK
jgi:hypothetical protein